MKSDGKKAARATEDHKVDGRQLARVGGGARVVDGAKWYDMTLWVDETDGKRAFPALAMRAAWLAGALVFLEDRPVAALFSAPEAGGSLRTNAGG